MHDANFGSMDKPTDAFTWPVAFDTRAQLNQLRVASQPTPISTLRTPRTQSNVPTVPKAVSGIRISRAPVGNSTKVTVRFHRDPADTAYQSANIYLKQANGKQALVSTTMGTQVVFTVPRTGAASVVTVQSVGTGSSISLARSPSKSVSLI
jgi:hypothetical protein